VGVLVEVDVPRAPQQLLAALPQRLAGLLALGLGCLGRHRRSLVRPVFLDAENAPRPLADLRAGRAEELARLLSARITRLPVSADVFMVQRALRQGIVRSLSRSESIPLPKTLAEQTRA
jgi:hypothetical protein